MKRLICLAILCALLWGCAAQEASVSKTDFVMDTVMTYQFWGSDAQAAADEIHALLRDLENTWSATAEDSTLSALNLGAASLTSEQQALLDTAEALSVRTGGAFDPKLHTVISAWGFLSDDHRIPTQSELTDALNADLWNLGAIVKGYAGQQAVEKLKDLHIDRAILNLGGNIQTYGEKPDGTPWQIGIQDPNGGDPVGIVSVTGTTAVVTSGDYQRYFEKDGIRYHHILDPKTGYPADSGLTSVTVICQNGTVADALSTALYVMGLEEATKFWQNSNDFEAVFISQSGQVYATEGVVLSGCTYEVIYREN